MTAQRTLIPALVLAAGLACTASAQAQPYGNAWGYSRGDTRAAFDNGLLTIELVREIPEAMKPRRIAIAGATSSGNVHQIEAKAA